MAWGCPGPWLESFAGDRLGVWLAAPPCKWIYNPLLAPGAGETPGSPSMCAPAVPLLKFTEQATVWRQFNYNEPS